MGLSIVNEPKMNKIVRHRHVMMANLPVQHIRIPHSESESNHFDVTTIGIILIDGKIVLLF